jgi:hypothetical protein
MKSKMTKCRVGLLLLGRAISPGQNGGKPILRNRISMQPMRSFGHGVKRPPFLLPQANGHACVDFGCTHPIDGLF